MSSTHLALPESASVSPYLPASEARFRTLCDSAPLGIFECDAAGGVIYFNLALALLSGRPATASLGQGWEESIHPDDRAAMSAGWKRAATAGSPWDEQQRLLRPDGSERWVHTIAAPTKDAAGGITGFVGTVEDITARKRAEESLRLLSSAAEQTTESIMITDAELVFPGPKIIFVNPAFTRMTGYTAAEVLGQTPRILQGPLTDRKVLSRLRENLAHGRAFAGEAINYRKDGQPYDQAWQIAPIRNDQGKITHFVALQRDVTAQKQSEEKLREKTAFLEAKLDASIDGILVVDNQGNKILQNQRFRELFKIPNVLIDIIHDPETRQFVAAQMRHPEEFLAKVLHLNTHPDETSRDELELKDGRFIDRYSSPVLGREGKNYGRIWTFRDITARRQSDNQLQASETRYRRLFEAAQDGILILNAETGMIEDVNPFLINLLGLTKEQFLQRKVWELGSFQHLIANQDKFLELQRNEYVRYEDLPLLASDGRRIDVEFVSNVYEEGGAKVIQCNIRDISARKAAERAHGESEERFRLVARAVSDVVWDWDLTANTLWWNDGFLNTFGFQANEIEPGIESWTNRIHADDRRRVADGIHQAIDAGAESWQADYRFQRKDGSYAFVQDRGYILRDATGHGVRMVGGMRDLTEQRKMEAQYLRAQRMDSIGTLAGGIAHDLNNVLAPIMMSIELLKLDPGTDPRRGKILDTIQASTRRGADLVRQVLSFARGLDGLQVAIRLRLLIDDLAGIIRETFPRNLQLVTDVPDDLWPITGDPTQIHQVLLNLAVNARDAMPESGTLTLTAVNFTMDAQFAGMSKDARTGPYVLLQVTDTGLGIAPELRERIFDPFFTTKEIGKGTGIGLATVHTIVKSHGGFLTVESDIGHGTTFKIYLPADPTLRSAATPSPFAGELPRGQNELVLVVDDESSIREITRQTLEAFGYRVLTANDGADAVALYAKQRTEIAAVLTDMMMPIMNGAATINVLQRINPAVKIIAVSGIDSGDNVAKATRAGVKDFLPKPYSADTLLKVLRKALDRPGARPAS